MASNTHANAFMREKEILGLIFDQMALLIRNILSGVMPSLKRVGLPSELGRSVKESLQTNQGKIESLKTTLTRKKMKVTFFGPTSSGKSTVINAILGKDLLACGMGQITSCFLTIEQTDDSPVHGRRSSHLDSELGSHFIIRSLGGQWSSNVKARVAPQKKNVTIPLDVEILHNLSDASASDTSLDVSFNIEVFLASYDHRCPLLSQYLQIVDCPGVGSCRDLGDRVKYFCGDADVHVLIVNSESGITTEDKEHFLRVKERLPNPDIIIGFTKWDRSANQKPQQNKRLIQQHLLVAFELLKSTGSVSNMEQAREMCFFISGQEALDDALGEQVKYVKGQPEREQAFHDFVRKIKEQASIAGKKAKLEGNHQACQNILRSCLHNICSLKEWICHRSNDLVVESETIKESLRRIDIKLEEYWRESKKQREKALTEVEEELMDCMGNVIGRMRIALANNTKSMKAFNSDFHEHGVTVVHDWYANIIKSCQRTTRMVCEEYSRDLLATYKKCFQEFPHIHPTAFIEALHEEIFPLDQDSNENKVPSQERVDHLLRGVTDKGLIAMFATTRKRAKDGNE
eukprot:XP_011667825.1 PREDICTED: mitofusin-2-like [Strongylocentrotus purpuratus]